MNVFQIIGDGMPAVGMTRSNGRANMLGWGFGGNLVEVNHTAPVPCQLIDIKFDPFHYGFDRSIAKQGSIDTKDYQEVKKKFAAAPKP